MRSRSFGRLNSPRMPFTAFFRTTLFLRVVTTTAIVGVVMQFIFNPASGPINVFLVQTGLLDTGTNLSWRSSCHRGPRRHETERACAQGDHARHQLGDDLITSSSPTTATTSPSTTCSARVLGCPRC